MNYRFIIISFFVLTAFSCAKDEVREDISFPKQTVLIYMAADNNLYRNAETDIEEILKSEVPQNNHLLIYLDVPEWYGDGCAQLFEVRRGSLIQVKQYGQQNSASGEVLQSVINDVTAIFPAEKYGLILWSHGTGWLPENKYDELKEEKLRSFGKDGNREMNLIELSESIPVKFEYIIFDACLMGGIEVFYQLRNKANIIIASPAEILVAGFPYDKIVPFLFYPNLDYIRIAQEYMNYYKNKTGILQSASISVVNTRQLKPLAEVLRTILNENNIISPDKMSVQKYEMREQAIFYDLEDYLSQAIQNQIAITELKQQISKTVIYHDFTPYFLETLAIERSCGISIYVSPSTNNDLDEQYKQLDWHKDSGLLCQ
jgi:hypothetical protein